MTPYSILITGVGGQGTLLAAKIVSRAAALAGFDVKTSEVHGMAQRGGAVASHVRFDKTKVYSPVIDIGRADAVLALEMLEALRGADYLKPEGRMFVSEQTIYPSSVTAGFAVYPPDIAQSLKKRFAPERLTFIDAVCEAQKALDNGGDLNRAVLSGEKCANVFMLGVLAAHLSADAQTRQIEEDLWREAVKTSVKPRFARVNEQVFSAGFLCFRSMR